MFISNHVELECIRHCMEQYYTPIRAVYKHYSGLGSVLGDQDANDSSMSFHELQSFCEKVKIFDERVTVKTLKKVWSLWSG